MVAIKLHLILNARNKSDEKKKGCFVGVSFFRYLCLMDQKLLDYIKLLTKADTKSLVGKVAKTAEETGELAKAVLPYENASGTLHRFTEKESILEECADVFLCVQSIAYQLGFSDEDFESMVQSKAESWQELQVKEEGLEFPIPYEIHITVEITEKSEIDYFKQTCKEVNVKPIVIDLENNGEHVTRDVMTSSHHFGDNASVYEEMQRIENFLKKEGFKVVRSKIETVPWHPAAPSSYGDKMPNDCYFEAHVGCIVSPLDKLKLKTYTDKNDLLHLSRNAFKKLEDGKFVNMITFRRYDTHFSVFEGQLNSYLADLDMMDIEYEKVITEFAIYDTKVSHDFLWLEEKVKA